MLRIPSLEGTFRIELDNDPQKLMREADVAADDLDNPDAAARSRAVKQLGLIGDHAIAYAEKVAALLDDEDEAVRDNAIWALGNMGAENYAGPVAALLREDDEAVRKSALATLRLQGTKGSVHAVEVMAEFCTGPFSASPPLTMKALEILLGCETLQIRCRIVNVLRTLGEGGIVVFLADS